MRLRPRRLIVAALISCSAASLSAGQSQSLRDLAREHGAANLVVISCGPLIGLREIVQHTQLTVEGTVRVAESSLTAEEDNVYTDYLVDVIRLFRLPNQTAPRSHPGQTEFSPFVADGPLMRPTAATQLRVRLRKHDHGQVVVDGGVPPSRALATARRARRASCLGLVAVALSLSAWHCESAVVNAET